MSVKRMLRRLLKWGLWSSLLLVTSAVALASYVLTTEAGARLALRTAVAQFELPITYGDVSGSIAGRLEVSDLNLEIDGLSARIDHLAVEWRLTELRHRRLHIEFVQISGTRSVLRPEALGGSAPDSTAELQDDERQDGGQVLPIDLIVDVLQLRDAALTVMDVGESYAINLDAAGVIDSFRVEGSMIVVAPEVGTAALEISGTGSDRGIELSRLHADVLDGILQAQGSLVWTPKVEWRANVQADSLTPAQLASTPADWPGRISLRGSTEGSVGDTLMARVQLDTLSGVLRDFPLSGTLSGVIHGSQYSISDLDLDWGSLRVRGEGEFGDRLEAVFEIDAPDLSMVLPDTRGSVSASGSMAGTRSAPRVDASLVARNVEVAGIRVEDADADVDVNWAPGEANDISVRASGVQIGERTAETLVLEAQGTREDHTVSAHATGEKLEVRLAAAGGVNGISWAGVLGDLSVETETLGSWVLEGEAPLSAAESEVELSEFCIVSSKGHLCAEGSWTAAEGWHATASVEQVPLALTGPLLPNGPALSGMASGDIDAAASSDGPITADVVLRTGPGAIDFAIGDTIRSIAFARTEVILLADADSTVGQLTLDIPGEESNDPGRLSGEIRLSALTGLSEENENEPLIPLLEDGRASISIQRVPMSLIDFLLPGEATVSGTLDGEIDAVTDADGSLTGEATLRPGPGEIGYSSGGERQTIDYEEGTILIRIDQRGLDGQLSLAWGDPDSATFAAFSGAVQLPGYSNLNQRLQAQRITAQVEGGWELSIIDALSDNFSGSVGRLDVNLGASGTVAEPNMTGTIRVSGQTDIGNLGIRLREIELTATADAAEQLEIVGQALSGDGRISIEGSSPLIPSKESPGRITLQGDRFLAAETEQVRLEMSPNIEVLLTGGQIEVSGDVTIPAANIDILEIPAAAVPVSRDVVIVGEEEEDGRDSPISANVRVVLGDAVFFNGFGFRSRLLGAITVTESPGAPTRGSGEVIFRDGIYRGYGQNLQVDPGRLVFAGPIDNPGLDVRAYRTAADRTRAGLLVRGTLEDPDIQVWSDPVMSESDALAYMLFGHSMDQGSEADQANAATAAAALGGSMLAMSMASQVGLDEARIETGSKREDAAFVAGKYISPRLFVAYGIGLYEPINTLRIRYLISPKWTLQSVTGDRTATDILYRIER